MEEWVSPTRRSTDLAHPRRPGRREADMPKRPLSQPILDGFGLVHRIVLHDQMQVEIVGNVGLDLGEEFAELGQTVPAARFNSMGIGLLHLSDSSIDLTGARAQSFAMNAPEASPARVSRMRLPDVSC